MEYIIQRPIYRQIVNTLSERILTGEWNNGTRMPSVRKLGVEFRVTPNTVLRAYDYLQSYEVIYSKRGIGYFVADDAEVNIKDFQKTETRLKLNKY